MQAGHHQAETADPPRERLGPGRGCRRAETGGPEPARAPLRTCWFTPDGVVAYPHEDGAWSTSAHGQGWTRACLHEAADRRGRSGRTWEASGSAIQKGQNVFATRARPLVAAGTDAANDDICLQRQIGVISLGSTNSLKNRKRYQTQLSVPYEVSLERSGEGWCPRPLSPSALS